MTKSKNRKNQKFCLLRKRGFSLIEVLIAMTILSVGVTSISVLMAGNIRNSHNTRDQIVASSLAQEGIELVRNLKDNNQLNSSPYDKCASGSCVLSGLTVDPVASSPNIALNNPGPDARLYLSAGNGYFTHSNSGSPLKFYRTITLLIVGDRALAPSTRVMTVVSQVWWGGSVSPATCNIANKCVAISSVMPDYKN